MQFLQRRRGPADGVERFRGAAQGTTSPVVYVAMGAVARPASGTRDDAWKSQPGFSMKFQTPPRASTRVDKPLAPRCAWIAATNPESRPRPHAQPSRRAHMTKTSARAHCTAL